MEEQLVSFETAKLAKEKGFVDIVGKFRGKSYYTHKGEINGDVSDSIKKHIELRKLGITDANSDNNNKLQPIAAPTQSLLQKWLRDVHQIIIEVNTDCTCEPKYCFEINVFTGNPRDLAEKGWGWYFHKQEPWYLYYTYEDALEHALLEGLNLIGKDLLFND